MQQENVLPKLFSATLTIPEDLHNFHFDWLQVKDKKFDNKVEWGIDLASEHERWVPDPWVQVVTAW